jgi:hypothetical protein
MYRLDAGAPGASGLDAGSRRPSGRLVLIE